MVEAELDNISRKSEQRVSSTIALVYGMGAQDIKDLLQQLKLFLDAQPELNPAESRVTLLDLATSGMKIEIVYFVKGNNASVLFATREKVNLEILTLVEKFHGKFAVER